MGYYNRIIVGVLLAACGVMAVTAQTQTREPALTVLLSGSTEHVQYKLDDISEIFFSGDDMIVTHADGTTTHTIDTIDAMRFDIELDITAIEQVLAPGITVSASAGIVTITADEGTSLTVSVFDIGGRMLQNFTATTTTSVDMTALTTGIYIIKVNNKVIKYRN